MPSYPFLTKPLAFLLGCTHVHYISVHTVAKYVSITDRQTHQHTHTYRSSTITLSAYVNLHVGLITCWSLLWLPVVISISSLNCSWSARANSSSYMHNIIIIHTCTCTCNGTPIHQYTAKIIMIASKQFAARSHQSCLPVSTRPLFKIITITLGNSLVVTAIINPQSSWYITASQKNFLHAHRQFNRTASKLVATVLLSTCTWTCIYVLPISK